MGKALVHAVGDGAIGKQRGKNLSTAIKQVAGTTDIQIGFLLTGKRGSRQVFCSGGAANCYIGILAVLLFHLLISLLDLISQLLGDLAIHDPLPDLRSRCEQGIEVMSIQPIECSSDFFMEIVVFNVKPVGRRGGSKAIWNLDTLVGQGAEHLSQGSVFPTNNWYIVDTQFRKPFDVLHRAISLLFCLSTQGKNVKFLCSPSLLR